MALPSVRSISSRLALAGFVAGTVVAASSRADAYPYRYWGGPPVVVGVPPPVVYAPPPVVYGYPHRVWVPGYWAGYWRGGYWHRGWWHRGYWR